MNRWLSSVGALRTSSGRLFQAAGAATANARLPSSRRVRGTNRVLRAADRSEDRGRIEATGTHNSRSRRHGLDSKLRTAGPTRCYQGRAHAANLSTLVSRRDDLFQKNFSHRNQPSSCLHCFLPPHKKQALTSRLIGLMKNFHEYTRVLHIDATVRC